MNDSLDWSRWAPEPSVIDPCELLADRAEARPNEIAFTFMKRGGVQQGCTWAELETRARCIAARLIAVGAKRALLIDVPRLEFLVALLACMKAGVEAIPAMPPRGKRTRERVASVLADAGPDVVMGVSSLPKTEQQLSASVRNWIATDALPESAPIKDARRPFDPDRVALVQYTSGSTSEPRGMLIDYRNLSAQQRALRTAFGHGSGARVVTWLPPYHDMGLIGGLFHPLYAGIPCLWFAPQTFLAEPASWLRAISQFRGTTSGGPDFAYELCVRRVTDEQMEGVDLSSWSVAFNGSEPVRAETLERFASRFGRYGFRPEAFLPCYGLAEATLMVSGARPGVGPTSVRLDRDAFEDGRAMVSGKHGGRQVVLTGCGRPVRDTQVRIVQVENGRPSPDSTVGEIWVSGPSIVRGYVGRSDAEAFTIGLAGDGQRYVKTGDLGFIDPGGELFVVGRLKDSLIIRGQNHHPEDLERTVQTAFPLLRPACGAVFSVEGVGEEQAILVHEVDPATLDTEGGAQLRDRIVARIGQEHGIHLHEVVFVAPSTLPRTTSGKIRRREVRRHFIARELKQLAFGPPTDSSAAEEQDAELRQVIECFGAVLPGKRRFLNADADFFGLGGDSLSAHELVGLLDKRGSVRLDVGDLFAAPTPRLLAARLLERRTAEKGLVASGVGSLSPAQRRIWFAEQVRPGHPFYHVGLRLTVGSDVTAAEVERALAQLASQQPALRASIEVSDGAPQQRVAVKGAIPLAVVVAQDDEELDLLVRDEVARPFELSGPLARALLISGPLGHGSGGAEQTLVLSIHHIVCDGWGARRAVTELLQFLDPTDGDAQPQVAADEAYLLACSKAAARAAAAATASAAYWRGVLDNAPDGMPLPVDHERPTAPRGMGARCETILDRATWGRVALAAERAKATPFIVLASALAVVLRTVSARTDVVFGTVVAQLPDAAAARLIGCHLNFLPIRLALPDGMALGDVVERTKGAVASALQHADFPFEEMVRVVNPRRDLRGNPLYNVGIWFHDFALSLPEAARKCVSVVETNTSELDLRLVATPRSDGRLSVALEYATELFREPTARRILEGYIGALSLMTREPSRAIQDLDREIPADLPKVVARRIAIAANFTIEPIVEVLEHWAARLALRLRVEFAPYDQIEQQLLDPNGLFRAGKGTLGFIVVDVDAWVGADGNFGRVATFASVVEGADLKTDLLIAVCPASDSRVPARAEGLARARDLLLGLSDTNRAVSVLDLAGLGWRYGIATEREPYLDELGRIPFNEGWFAALGTTLFRQVRCRSRPAKKVLVLDCDHTLWDGECGSEGAAAIRVPQHKRAFQLAAKRLAAEGTLLCLCSHNIETDVLEAFSHPDMVLALADITARRVNWRPKSESLRSLAEELNLALDSFVMVDDDPAVCAEVEAACPEVTVVRLPAGGGAQEVLLDHLWELDRPRITAEDRERAKAYRDEARRRELRTRAITLDAFLEQLGVTINVRPAGEKDVPRVAQLFARANQFNLAATRYDESEIAEFLRDGAPECWVTEVTDRFGDYGLTGVVVLAQGDGLLEVQSMALSCRILGRGVEQKLVAELQSLARQRGLRELRFAYRKAARNEPALSFLAGLAGPLDAPTGTRRVTLDAAVASARPHRKVPSLQGAVDGVGRFSAGIPIPLSERSTAAAILQAMRATSNARPESAGAYVPPNGPIEERIADIFRSVLRVDRVGARDNFFALGGHSLLALKVLWHVHHDFGIDVELTRLYDSPTVTGLTDAIVASLIDLDVHRVLEHTLSQQGTPRS
jgi:FkbH-like protein